MPRSEMGAEVARRVIKAVGEGRKPQKTKIAREVGYSEQAARAGKGTENEGYKEVMFDAVAALEAERNRLILAMGQKDLSKEQYKTLVEGMDKTTKNVQLLGGKPTEINQFTIEDVKKRLDNL